MKEVKEKFIRKYARDDVVYYKTGGGIVEHHQQLESDLDALLKQHAIEFVDFITKEDSPYGVLFGNQPERLCTKDEDFTIEQVYDNWITPK